jgi:hypothetical protein
VRAHITARLWKGRSRLLTLVVTACPHPDLVALEALLLFDTAVYRPLPSIKESVGLTACWSPPRTPSSIGRSPPRGKVENVEPVLRSVAGEHFYSTSPRASAVSSTTRTKSRTACGVLASHLGRGLGGGSLVRDSNATTAPLRKPSSRTPGCRVHVHLSRDRTAGLTE